MEKWIWKKCPMATAAFLSIPQKKICFCFWVLVLICLYLVFPCSLQHWREDLARKPWAPFPCTLQAPVRSPFGWSWAASSPVAIIKACTVRAGASWEEGGCATGFSVVPFRGCLDKLLKWPQRHCLHSNYYFRLTLVCLLRMNYIARMCAHTHACTYTRQFSSNFLKSCLVLINPLYFQEWGGIFCRSLCKYIQFWM